MRLFKRAAAVAVAPVLLAGMMMGGSAAFVHASHTVAPKTVVGLNQRSDTIFFTGVFTVGAGVFALRSTSCTLDDGNWTTTGCRVQGGGHITDPQTKSATGTVTITGHDGTITFQQTANGGCSFGNGIEIEPAELNRPIPIRTEGTSEIIGQISANQFVVSGRIDVYEAGGIGEIGQGCGLS